MLDFMQAGGPMYRFVMALVLGVGLLFAVLMTIIIVNKAWRQIVDARLRRRRAVLEPAFFRYAVGEGPIEDYLPGPLRRGERVLVENIFFELGHVVKGGVRDRAREAFERLGFVDHYMRRLSSRRWWTRAEAAEKLGLIGSHEATTALIRAMDDPVPEVRVRAARALGSIRTNEALVPLVEALRDPGRWSAIRVAGILIGAGDDAVEVLLEAYPRLPLHAQVSAIDIFGRSRSLKAVALLRDLLKDREPDVRARAAFALGAVGDPNAAAWLTEALSDRAWAVRAMAARALGRLKEEGSIGALCSALADQQWWVRANAAEALKNKGDVGVRALLGMLDAADPYAAQQAVQMLQESGVLDALIAQLASADGDLRQQALDVMAKLVRLKRTDLLTEMAHNHPESPIRQRLAIILGIRLRPESAA